jgi:tetratricopeptide (TPR) repeat protein
MSVIFQSLQKLDAELNSSNSATGTGASDSRSPIWKLIVCMRLLVIGLILVLAFGSGAVYAVQYLKKRLPDSNAAISDASLTPQVYAIHSMHAPEKESQGVAPGALTPAGGAKNIQFYPPGEDVDGQPAPAAPVPQVAAAQTGVDVPSAGPPGTLVAAAISSGAPPMEHVREADTGVTSAVQDARKKEAELEAAERARRAVLEKNAKIGRLVHEVEAALSGGADEARIQGLLAALERIKGKDHPYMVKLRGYWLFRQRRFQAAEKEFSKVILVNPNDLEAGINLALIEIDQQDFTQALARLKALRKIYPENATIADLIKRLR